MELSADELQPAGGATTPGRATVRSSLGRESCVVLVPVSDRIEPECDDALRVLEGRGYQVRRGHGFPAVDQARNALATRALRDGFAELMWIDADIGFDPDDVDRLRAHGLPMSCGLYAKKAARSFAAEFGAGQSVVTFGGRGGLLEVGSAGMGFAHTRREVYQAIQDRGGLRPCDDPSGEEVWPFFVPMVVPGGSGFRYLDAGLAFCERVRSAGFDIVADTRLRLWSIGSYRYGWEDAGRSVERFARYDFYRSVTRRGRSSDGARTWPRGSVVIDCQRAAHAWGPDTLADGMGGAEEAVVYLSRELARAGTPVVVYNERGVAVQDHVLTPGGDPVAVDYLPWHEIDLTDEFDVFVSWRSPGRLKDVRARLRLCDLHDPANPDVVYENLPFVDKYLFKTQYHRRLHPRVPDAQAVVIGNGLRKEQFLG